MNKELAVEKLQKKAESKPEPVRIFLFRTMASAVAVVERIETITFQEASTGVFELCQALGGGLAHEFEAQVELAGANPGRFILQLHNFYSVLSAKIRKEDRYSEVFALIAGCNELSDTYTMAFAFLDLLLQFVTYLSPERYDFSIILAGRKLTRELITINDPFGRIDSPLHAIVSSMKKGSDKPKAFDWDKLSESWARLGFRVNNVYDLQMLMHASDLFTVNTYSMFQFVNEYTMEFTVSRPLLLDEPLNLPLSFVDTDTLKEALTHRRRMLPPTGVLLKFEDAKDLKTIQISENYYKDELVCLYKFETTKGEFSGYYKPNSKCFMSVFFTSSRKDFHAATEALTLYLYCAFVANVTGTSLDCFSKCFSFGKVSIVKRRDNIGTSKLLIGGKPSRQYIQELRNINGYIRRLPPGKVASVEAVRRARQLGFELADNETYVQPFTKHVRIVCDQ